MTNLHDILETHVSNGSVPGAVGLVARGDRVEVQAVGSVDVGATSPMARDSIFRIASITKPITAAGVMMLVDDGRIGLDDRSSNGCRSWRHRPSSARRPVRSTTWSRLPGRSPWSTCSPPVLGTASLPTSRCLWSNCCSTRC
jgi:hypothetical protein